MPLLPKNSRPLWKESTPDILRWVGKTAVLGAVSVSLLVALGKTFSIGWDRQTIKSMDASIFIVNKLDAEPVRGKTFAYVSEQSAPVIPSGFLMWKQLLGMPGDTVEVRQEDDAVLINGKEVARGMPQLRGIPMEKRKKYYGRTVLKEDEYWMIGTQPLSFDSRYWGAIHKSQLIGRAYALF